MTTSDRVNPRRPTWTGRFRTTSQHPLCLNVDASPHVVKRRTANSGISGKQPRADERLLREDLAEYELSWLLGKEQAAAVDVAEPSVEVLCAFGG